MLDAVKDDAQEGADLDTSGSRIRILLKSYRYLPMLNAVKDDAAEGAAVGGPLLRGQVGQLMLLQLSLKPVHSRVSHNLHFG